MLWFRYCHRGIVYSIYNKLLYYYFLVLFQQYFIYRDDVDPMNNFRCTIINTLRLIYHQNELSQDSVLKTVEIFEWNLFTRMVWVEDSTKNIQISSKTSTNDVLLFETVFPKLDNKRNDWKMCSLLLRINNIRYQNDAK